MENRTQITIPTYAELNPPQQYSPQAWRDRILITDYAVGTGATINHHEQRKRNCLQYGPIWVREAGRHQGQVCTDNGLAHAFNRRESAADSNAVAVAPRLLNPEAQGFAVGFLNGDPVLTQNGAVPCWPLYEVEPELAQELSWTLQAGLGSIPEVGAYTSDGAPFSPSNSQPYQPQVNKCYAFRGKNYVYIERAKHRHLAPERPEENAVKHRHIRYDTPDAWYECGAIPARECADGSIQINVGLFTSRFAASRDDYEATCHQATGDSRILDTDQFFLGEQLNTVFLRELELSTHFTHLQLPEKLTNVAQFAATGLKAQARQKDERTL